MSAEVTFRDLRERDVATVVEIAVAAWEPIYSHYRQLLGEDLFAATRPAWRAEKERQVRAACTTSEPGTALVAVIDGHVVAFLTFAADRDSGVGTLTNNAVAPAWQGHGIGTRLYAFALERMRTLGLRYARVTTGGDAAHAPARRAYEKAGFEAKLSQVEYYREL